YLVLDTTLGGGPRAAAQVVRPDDVAIHVEALALTESGRRRTRNSACLLELHFGWRVDRILLREDVAAAVRREPKRVFRSCQHVVVEVARHDRPPHHLLVQQQGDRLERIAEGIWRPGRR